jgi:hypothetical protein
VCWVVAIRSPLFRASSDYFSSELASGHVFQWRHDTNATEIRNV